MEEHPAEVLTSTVTRLATAGTLEEITGVVAHALRTLMRADGATFVLREDDRCFYVDEDAIGPLWKGQKFPLTACISGWAMRHREQAVIPDIYADDRIPHDAYRPTFVQSLSMAPIRTADPIGALGAYWSRQHTPTPAQLKMQQVLADSTAVALENLELRGAVERRRTERDDLETAMFTLGHDLRNPLGAVQGYSELILETAEEPEKVRIFARTMVEQVRQMADQIDAMLQVRRVTAQPPAPEPLDLTAMALEVVDRLRFSEPDRRVAVQVEEGLRATADPVLARILLDNLLGNAFKYTGRTTAPEVSLAAVETGGPLTTFRVRDNGAGFEPSEKGRLFQPMTRLHAADEFAGTGLGLASVARIVELHGGSVDADGRPGRGADFLFSLPR